MNGCNHPRAIVGLDGTWCPDCQRTFPTVPSPNQQLKDSASKQLEKLLPSVPSENRDAPIPPVPTVPPDNRLWMTTRTYRSRGSLYYRFAWGIGDTIKQNIHIPGGCTDSPISTARREMVDHWIAIGHMPPEIVRAIAKWRNKH
jgi:hypothetical protein